ncbi:MAG: type II toxin-antitoxin system Phd/YefM family antitoxin [Betaproteobacteria bacterium]
MARRVDAQRAMSVVDVGDAARRLSRLLKAVEAGEQFVIARGGQPVAVLRAYQAPRRKIEPPGRMAAEGWWMAEDFDEPVDQLFDALAPTMESRRTGPRSGAR